MKKGDSPTFKRIYRSLENDGRKTNLVKKLVSKGDYAIAVSTAIDLRIPENETEILLMMMQEDVDPNVYYPLIDEVSRKNQPQLKYPLNMLIDQGKENERLFEKILSYATHTITLHKVASYLIGSDKLHTETFRKVALKIAEKNRAESRKLGEDLIDGNFEGSSEFDLVLRETVKGNQIEGAKLLIYLLRINKELYCKFKKEGIITSAVALERMEEAEKQYGSCK